MDLGKLPLTARLALCALLALPASAEAGVYQWQDAEGRVHFGEKPPVNAVDARELGFRKAAAEQGLALSIHEQGTLLAPEVRRGADEGMRQILRAWQQTFRVSLNRQLVVDVQVFDNREALARWIIASTGMPAGTVPDNILGIYIPDRQQVGVINRADDPDGTLRTLLHESTHVLLAQLSPNAPPWLHEGLAQYFEGIGSIDGKLVIQPHARNDVFIRDMIARDKLIALRTYLSIPPDRWRQIAHGEGNPVPYVVAWSLTSFLMAQPTRRQMLVSMLQDLEKAKIAPDLGTFVRRYPGGLDLLEYDWYRWAMQPAATQKLE